MIDVYTKPALDIDALIDDMGLDGMRGNKALSDSALDAGVHDIIMKLIQAPFGANQKSLATLYSQLLMTYR